MVFDDEPNIVCDGKYIARVTHVQEGVSKKGNQITKVFLQPHKKGEYYEEVLICINRRYKKYRTSVPYKFMQQIGLLQKKSLNESEILKAAKKHKFVINIVTENGFPNVKEIKLYQRKNTSKTGVNDEQ